MRLGTSKRVGLRAYLLISLTCLLPIIFLIVEGWRLPAQDLESWTFLSKDVVPQLIFNSFSLTSLTILFSSLIAIVSAILLELTNIRGRKFWNVALILPLAFPLYVLAFVYVGIFEWSGPVLSFLREQGFSFLGNLKFKNVFGVAFVLSLGLFPYILIPLRLVLKKVNLNLFHSSLSLGQGTWTFIRKIVLPICFIPLFAGSSIVAMEVLADFGAVSVFNFDTFTTAIYMAWSSLFSLGSASRLSLFLLFFSVGLFLLEGHLAKKHFSLDASEYQGPLIKLSKLFHFLGLLFLGAVFLFSILIPLTQLFIWAMESWIVELSSSYFDLIVNTSLLGLRVALIVSLSTTILCFIERNQYANKVLSILRSTILIGYALPGSIVAVAVFLLFKNILSTSPLDLGISLVVIGLSYRFLSIGHRTIIPTVRLMKPELEFASRSLGQSTIKYISRIWFPFIKSNIVYAFIFVFIEVSKEMPLTLMLRPMGHDTLATKIFELTSEGEWERASVGALTLVFIGIIMMLLMNRSQRGKK